MLQQTQVTTAIAYFERFVRRFPDILNLAQASEDQVLGVWTGLGYYARARNLHRAARRVVDEHGGVCPADYTALAALPGIGRSTAAAILALAFDQPHAILDGNVKRVLARYHTVSGWPGSQPTNRVLWRFAEQHTPTSQVRKYTQGIMDLGTSVCRRARPACGECPLRPRCLAHAQSLTGCLPTPRPKRQRPMRGARFAVVRNPRAEIRLVKRPPHGVWGGLFGFPDIPPETEPLDWCRTAMGARVKEVREFTRVRSRLHPFHPACEAGVDRVG